MLNKKILIYDDYSGDVYWVDEEWLNDVKEKFNELNLYDLEDEQMTIDEWMQFCLKESE